MIRRWLRLWADNERLSRLADARARQIDSLRTVVAEPTGRNARSAQRQAVLMGVLADHIARREPVSSLREAITGAGFGAELAFAIRRLPATAATVSGVGDER